MKSSKILLSIVAIIFFAASIQAKDLYYYYKGERIPLVISDDSVSVYTQNLDRGSGNQLAYYSNTISLKEKKSIDNNSITSIEYIVKGDINKNVKMSNRFYVQLYDPIADIDKLHLIASETNTNIIGSVPNMPDWYELVVDNSMINNSLEMSNHFYETGLFKDIDPGFIFQFTSSSACVSDSYFSSQWGMDAINACDAWTLTNGNSNIKIAIIDTGIERYHNEFNINKFVDKYNCTTGTSNDYTVYNEHGTQVCGVIASNHNYAEIAGVAPNCEIIPICYSASNTNTVSANLASGFAWAVDHGADVINCSWGDHNSYDWLHSSILESAILNALENGRNGKGCVVVFSAGNQNSIQLDYPGRIFPDIITVGAIKSDYTKWENSSYGYDLDVVAPGHNIRTTDIWSNSSYTILAGTSFSAPHVSGIAGLMLSVNPYLTQKEVADIIESTAQKIGSNYNLYEEEDGRPNGKWNFEMGYGLVDAYAAVNKAKNTQIRGPQRMCETAVYHLIRPLQPGETINWTVENGYMLDPYYSIIGDDDKDSVIVRCEYLYQRFITDPIVGPDNLRKYLSATITSGDASETYTKTLLSANNKKPNISASNSAFIWPINTQRTFSITNCPLMSDSLLHWRVEETIALHIPIILTAHYYGHTLTYTPQNPPRRKISTVRIFASNESPSMCGEAFSDTLSFLILDTPTLLTNQPEKGLLNVTIAEDSGESLSPLLQLNEENNYTLELWHNIYGRMSEQVVQTTNIQINTNGLPLGIYVLVLKENSTIIAETKVQIN